MKARSDELIRFISRTFLAAAFAILVGLGVLMALFYQRSRDEWWARHSREVSRLGRQIEIASLRRLSVLRGHVALGGPVTVEALGVGDPQVASWLDSLRRLTADLPAQQQRADRIAAAFARWDAALVSPAQQGGRPQIFAVDRTRMSAAEAAFAPLSAEVTAFLDTEEKLYDLRVEAAHRVDRILIASTVLAVILMLVTLYFLRRRLISQAHESSVAAATLDLRNAQLIDQTRQMEQMIDQLQAGETRFRTLVESLHDVVFTLGHEKRFTGMFGGRAVDDSDAYKEFLGRTAVEILGPELGQVHMDAADRALRGESVTYEWSIEGGDRRMFYANTVSPLRGPGGEIRGVVGINRDVTAQVSRDKALAEAREQLRQAQRLEALGQLAGGVAHDFNNLLTVIMTYAAILQEEAAPGSDTAKSIDEIRMASERAAALTRQLLAFGRRQMLQPRAIDMNETVQDVERMLRRLLPPDITFETRLAKDLGLVMADPGQLEQVLINLAINARDAMPDGGRLIIETANVERRDASGAMAPHVLVIVNDTGVGMSPETKARVFEPFFTTKGIGKGTGLGLATVHGIIEQSGGRVTVDSELGRGTTFYILLPRHVAQPAAPDATPPARAGQRLQGSETILLVDDNEELRRVVKRMLARAGYAVVEAGTGGEALAYLDAGKHADLVLTDVMMPDMNGRVVMESVRQRHPGVQLLLMSGYNYDTAVRGMAQRGDVAFIEKPFTADKLLRKLREILKPSNSRGAA